MYIDFEMIRSVPSLKLCPPAIIFCSLLFFTNAALSQQKDTVTNELQQVIIKAYQQNVRLMDMPAAIGYASPSLINRFNNTGILPALNTLPGIQMEERSPSSYRLNIRSSSLRSPFGVRNIKIYYNDVPITDPGGNTYLNQLGFYNFHSVEIIKGPGSSLYGAGNGGAMLINSFATNDSVKLSVDAEAGSNGLQNYHAGFRTQGKRSLNEIHFQHQSAEGYRWNSSSRHDIFSWHSQINTSNRNEISGDFIYSDLYYQTPGGLTLTEFRNDPKSARPRVGATQGAEEAKAAIFQKNILAAIKDRYRISEHFDAMLVSYYAFTHLRNPAIRNFGDGREPHAGGRVMMDYHRELKKVVFKWQSGAEYQRGNFEENSYQNKKGKRDSLLSCDKIRTRQYFLFSQLTAACSDWIMTGGISLSNQKLNINRVFPSSNHYRRSFKDQLSPRIALLKKLGDDVSVYINYAKGFSPPAVTEVLPTGSALNTELQPELGNNYETGVRFSLFRDHLFADASVFHFKLNNTIVQRRDAAGGDFYVNAGSTKQAGAEMSMQYKFNLSTHSNDNIFWISGSLYDFRYNSFKQLNNDYSGNDLPGIAKNKLATGCNLKLDNLSAAFTYNYTGKFYLEDANKNITDPVHLLSIKLSHSFKAGNQIKINLFAGADNLLSESYSAGYDINAAAGRYYNAAAGRNFYGGVSFQLF
ncbi:MAG: hypothetical protein JWN76_2206 [Chitinophagaceae bacterium]|nr:hypothetical protein [Chitinophagaceae bacterium]